MPYIHYTHIYVYLGPIDRSNGARFFQKLVEAEACYVYIHIGIYFVNIDVYTRCLCDFDCTYEKYALIRIVLFIIYKYMYITNIHIIYNFGITQRESKLAMVYTFLPTDFT